MKIPILSAIQDRKADRVKNIRAETKYLEQRTTALKETATARDKALEAIIKLSQPQMTLNEQLYEGAGNRYSTSIWYNNFEHARKLSRIAEAESPAAQAMIGRFVDLVIGPRLTLQASPVWSLIEGAATSPEEQQKIIKKIETRWRLWAKKKKVSYNKENNHYKMSREAFESLLIDGEYFAILRYSNARRTNGFTVQLIKPESVQAINTQPLSGNTIESGIEYNSRGEAVAYHIISDPKKSKSVRVPKVGPKSGRVFVIHNKLGSNRRGVGILAGIITELTKLADYQALEIQAAVINALFAVVIETEIGGETKPVIPKTGIAGTTTTADEVVAFDDSEYEAKLKKTRFDKGGIIVQNMGEGQKAKSFDTKRPTANFEAFFKAVKRNLYSAKGMSLAVADYDFNGSYSAARGELLVFWIRVMTLRSDHSTEYEDVVYQGLLWGEIDSGRLSLPGWDNEDTRDAWSNASWTGPARPDIDPMRSGRAAELDSKNAWKTDTQIAAERGGGDWEENIERKIKENELKTEANTGLVTLEKTSYSNSNNVTESTTKTEEV